MCGLEKQRLKMCVGVFVPVSGWGLGLKRRGSGPRAAAWAVGKFRMVSSSWNELEFPWL